MINPQSKITSPLQDHINPSVNHYIRDIAPYVGGDILPQGVTRRINLASNENVYGCSPHVKQALRALNFDLSCYPSSHQTQLRDVIASVHNLDRDRILCSNGSEEFIHLICRTYATVGSEVIMPQHGFLAYAIATQSVGATCVYADQPHHTFSVDAILACLSDKTRIVFIDNPANPLGCMLAKNEIIRLHAALPPHILLVLDEAYAEYVDDAHYESGLTLFHSAHNVIVLRTASKIYGLASMRLGFCYADMPIIEALNRIRPPFNVNALAQYLGMIAYRDQDWVDECRMRNTKIRHNFYQFLKGLGLSVQPSYGNFITLHMPQPKDAQHVYDTLLKAGISVRSLAMYNLSKCLRITMGTDAHMNEVCDIMRDLYS